MAAGFVDDSFGDASIGAHWTFIQPEADGTAVESGGVVTLAVPANVGHDQYNGDRSANLLLQSGLSDDDFDVRVELGATQPDANYQLSGLYFENPEAAGTGSSADGEVRWIRVDRLHNGSPRVFVASTEAASSTTRINAFETFTWLRVVRVGDDWEIFTSTDGESWSSEGSFTWAFTLDRGGLSVGNAVTSSSPAWSDDFDNFSDAENAGAGGQADVTPAELVLEAPPAGTGGGTRTRQVTPAELILEAQPAAGEGGVAAASLIQSAVGTAADPSSVTFDSPVTPGSLLVIETAHRSGATSASITPGTWTEVVYEATDVANSSNRRGVGLYSFTVPDAWAGGDTFSVDPPGSNTHVSFAAEFSAPDHVLASTGAANSGASTATSLAVTVDDEVAAGDVLIVVGGVSRGGTDQSFTSATKIESLNDGSGNVNDLAAAVGWRSALAQPATTWSDDYLAATARTLSAVVAVWVREAGASEQSATVAPAELALTAVDPAATPGAVEASVAPAELELAAGTVTAAASVTAAVSPASLDLTAVDPAGVPGTVVGTVAPAVLDLVAETPAATPGVAAVALDPAVLELAASPVSAGPGAVSATVQPAVLDVAAVDPAAAPGVAAAVVAPAVLELVAVDPATTPTTIAAVAPATLDLAAVPVVGLAGAVSAAVSPAVLDLAVGDVDAVSGTAAAVAPAVLELSAGPAAAAPGAAGGLVAPAVLVLDAPPVAGEAGAPATVEAAVAPAALTLVGVSAVAAPGAVEVSIAPAVLELAALSVVEGGVAVFELVSGGATGRWEATAAARVWFEGGGVAVWETGDG